MGKSKNEVGTFKQFRWTKPIECFFFLEILANEAPKEIIHLILSKHLHLLEWLQLFLKNSMLNAHPIMCTIILEQ